ncbi:MAG: ATP-binding protein [Desulfobacterales bacterium]|nr:ATP-binding protein [Desulfobacterales bacterium]
MNKKLLALYSLKFNPFLPDVPVSALFVAPAVESFCFRMQNQAGEGGFAMISGEPGCGKSAALRILTERLGDLRDVLVGVLTRPQASVADFYREMGHLFQVALAPHNRWTGAKALRDKWQAHIEASLYRPVLIVDEAQEMKTAVLSELRLLSSTNLDSRSILTVVLAGDSRLTDRLHHPDLLPMASRIRTRLRTESATPRQLLDCLTHLLDKAGNPRLMTPEVQTALCEHAAGNLRLLMNMANELLAEAVHREVDQIDEKLFFETFDMQAAAKAAKRRKP